MTTLRIIYDNAVDRGTLTASSTAGSLAASNMQIDRKSKVWRSTTTSATLSCAWTTSEYVSGVIIPFCNLSATATITVRIYNVTSGGSPIYTSPATEAGPIVAAGYWAWGQEPLGVNAYSYGFSKYARVWIPNRYQAKRVEIDISDPSNPSGYLEVSRLVIGNHWSPQFNTSFGIPVSYVDTSVNSRAQSGDLISTIGIKYKKLVVDLNWLVAADRTILSSLLQKNGTSKSVFVSLFPEDEDVVKEQTYEIYGRLPATAQISHPMHMMYSSQLEIEEI